MSLQGLDLFTLLPAVYRIRDAQLSQQMTLLTPREQADLAALQALSPQLAPDQQAQLNELLAKAARGPLQSLLMVIQEQLEVVSEDLDQLLDDQFIETCAPWVIPYIGDLIGYRPVKGIAPAIDNPRAEVANTISYRRRKGTVQVMEELARDATGWGAHAVEFFLRLADAQYMNHIRLGSHYAPDLRDWQSGFYIDTGFDRTAHKVDVRRIGSSFATSRGRYNIQNLGIFLWSLGAWSVTKGPATEVGAPVAGEPLAYRFSSLGMDMPLFHKGISQGTEVVMLAEPYNVPYKLRRRALCADLRSGVGAKYYGETNSLVVYVDGTPLNPYQVQVCDLAGTDGSWANLPLGGPWKAAVDPELGRLALPAPAAGKKPDVRVSYLYGFNADLGGGEYARSMDEGDSKGFLVTDPAWVVPFPDPARFPDLQAAVSFAVGELALNGLVAVEITGFEGGSDVVTLTGGLNIDLPAGATLEIRSAEESRQTIILNGEILVTGATSSTVSLNGLLLAAGPAMTPNPAGPVALVHVPTQRPSGLPNQLGTLNLNHCTLLPGWAVKPDGAPVYPTLPVLVAEAPGLQIAAARSILGAVRVARLASLSASDTILDACTDTTAYSLPTNAAFTAPDNSVEGPSGGALTLVGCTVFGKVHSTLLVMVSDCILWAQLANGDTWAAPMVSDRKQAGCVRFSYLPAGAVTPRRFKCVEQGPGVPQPLFFATRYGTPRYAKLLATTDNTIRRGADDGGEMGAFHYLLAPQRESDLRIRLEEYLPVGMEFGLIYQS